MNYYSELQLDQESANRDSITQAFRRLALEYHPLKDRSQLAGNQLKFSKVCEAYEVLSDPELKDCYDQTGYEGLKNGQAKYVFNGDSYAVFKRVFGTSNPFGENFKNPEEIRLVDPQPTANNQPQDITVTLACSISEFYNGALKSFQFTRKVL